MPPPASASIRLDANDRWVSSFFTSSNSDLLIIGLNTTGTGQLNWGRISKTGSSLADLATRSAADLNTGILPDGRLSDNVITALGAYDDPSWLTHLAGSKLTGEINSTKLQGRAVASTAPTSGQALAWNGTSWTPTTISGGSAQVFEFNGSLTQVTTGGTVITLQNPVSHGQEYIIGWINPSGTYHHKFVIDLGYGGLDGTADNTVNVSGGSNDPNVVASFLAYSINDYLSSNDSGSAYDSGSGQVVMSQLQPGPGFGIYLNGDSYMGTLGNNQVIMSTGAPSGKSYRITSVMLFSSGATMFDSENDSITLHYEDTPGVGKDVAYGSNVINGVINLGPAFNPYDTNTFNMFKNGFNGGRLGITSTGFVGSNIDFCIRGIVS